LISPSDFEGSVVEETIENIVSVDVWNLEWKLRRSQKNIEGIYRIILN
jgi:hypothetical protein